MEFAKLINCQTAEEVRERVLEWSTDITKEDHLIRAAILEIHANIEYEIKIILYKILEKSLVIPPDKSIFEDSKNKLWNKIRRMSFSNVYQLLKPGFISFDYPDLLNIEEINKVRNLAVHGDIDKVIYKNRNPFKDHDCLAQIFFESWSARKDLNKYSDFVIQ